MLKMADEADNRQIPGSPLAADSSAEVSGRYTGRVTIHSTCVQGGLFPPRPVGRRQKRKKRHQRGFHALGSPRGNRGAQAYPSSLSSPSVK